MKRFARRVAASCFVLMSATSFAAEEFGSAKEAESLVVRAIKAIKTNKDKAYSEISDRSGPFVDRDLYVSVMDLQAKVLAHGGNAKMVGKDLIDLRDSEGSDFIRQRMEIAKSKAKFWQDFKWTDPVTKKFLPKSSYCERLDETLVCAGIYKR